MCRFAAYIGSAIALGQVIVEPEHSLLEQSQNANEAKLAVNGDGFGVAWYGDDEEPGIYHDVLPAWSDGNLLSLCRLIKSQVFLAHVRASTVGETSRTNCHPFSVGRWSFMHNGQIADFARIRRKLEASLSDELYGRKRGNTDSELLFLLALSHGLDDDPHQALRSAIQLIEAEQGSIASPNRITCCFSDGQSIYGYRYSSDGKSPTLYVGHPLGEKGQVLASEPLSTNSKIWKKVPDGEFVRLTLNSVKPPQLEVPVSRSVLGTMDEMLPLAI